FRKEKHQLDRILRRINQAIEQLVDPPTLARRLLQTSADLLSARQGAVYLREGQPPLYRLADYLCPVPSLTELSPGCPLIETLPGSGTLVCDSVRPWEADNARRWERGIAGGREGEPSNGGTCALATLVAPAQRQLQFLGGAVAHGLVHE